MRSGILAFSIVLVGLALMQPGSVRAQRVDSTAALSTHAAPPPARQIPGITMADQFPKACVGCHVNLPEQNLDARLSTLMQGWSEKVAPALLAKAQAAAPPGITLNGKHPTTKAALRDIPAGCVKCHGADSKKAPPFARLMHMIHLTGGEQNRFMTVMQGECTHCHKLDAATGVWSIPSAPEP